MRLIKSAISSSAFLAVLLLTFLMLNQQQFARSETNTAKAPVFLSIPPTEAKRLMDTRKDLVMLDVRTPRELNSGAIEGSTLVPLGALFRNQLTLPKTTPVMIICAVGGRSYAAGQMLRRYGYQEVYNLSGGISEWKKDGMPVVYP